MACPGLNLRFWPGYPALLGKTGARATRDLATLDYARTGRELAPVFPAMLGCARRGLGGTPESGVLAKHHWIPAFAGMTGQDRAQESAPTPQSAGVGARLAQPSIAAILGLSEPPCLSWIC